MKSERLKKLESELGDLEQWMKLGLVPKKELARHEEEILSLKDRITEEKERLAFLKENGELEEYTTPRRSPSKTVYPDTPSMSDIEMTETSDTTTYDMDTETSSDTEAADFTSGGGEEKEENYDDEDDEDPFSDRNRWRRGGIIDPDATDW